MRAPHDRATSANRGAEVRVAVDNGYLPQGQVEGRHIIRATLTAVGEDSIKVVVAGGPLYRMRDRFVEAGIGGAFIDPEGTPYRRYIRCLENANVSEAAGKEALEDLWNNVLKGAMLCASVDPDAEPPADSEVANYVDSLRAQPQFVWA